jgi:hypothetical protein
LFPVSRIPDDAEMMGTCEKELKRGWEDNIKMDLK